MSNKKAKKSNFVFILFFLGQQLVNGKLLVNSGEGQL